LLGVHENKSCRECHYTEEKDGTYHHRFSTLTQDCENCHTDIHQGQFKGKDKNDRMACHGFTDWETEKFDHARTNFKLQGGLKGIARKKCHKEVKTEKGIVVKYKFKEVKCIDCHAPQD
jgi:hypothetical protein